MANLTDYIEAGFRVMGLHSVDKNGCCTCGNKKCEALFKHPYSTSWQHSPHWSDEQLSTMHKLGQFDTGFGVLVNGYLIIDVDPRNGGNEGYAQLCSDTGIDFKEASGFVVATGGGGWHIYFSNPDNLSLLTHHKSYKGIDFKSSGFVVGCGSMHKSGIAYEKEKGHPSEVTPPPQKLIDLLQRKETHRATVDGATVDVSDQELVNMLAVISPDIDYMDWVQVGMAVHHATGGDGFSIWDNWSSKGKEYDASEMEYKWHSFGKSANPVTLGTLLHHAKESGYQESVEFTSDLTYAAPVVSDEIDISGVDLNRPPSFVGEVCEWIRSTSEFPAETIAVASALSIVSSASGLNYVSDDARPVYSNLFLFCVAGSGTGKGAMLTAVRKAMREIGYIRAVCGGEFKSQQAIVRNMMRNQIVAYVIDEIGLELSKVQGANAADYMHGVSKNLMAAYSSSDDSFSVEPEALEFAIKEIQKEMAACAKAIEENEDKSGFIKIRLEALSKQVETMKQYGGVKNPFVSLIGYTTGETFFNLVSGHSVKQGFFSRSLIFSEKETVPKFKEDFYGSPEFPDALKATLLGLSSTGAAGADGRIENYQDRKKVPTTEDGKKLLKKMRLEFYHKGVAAKEVGLESIYTRAYELMLKVSLVLAVGEGLRTAEHITWAYALVDRDLREKINLAAGNIAEEVNQIDEAICRRIISHLDKKDGAPITTGTIVNRVRTKKYNTIMINQCLDRLEKDGRIIKREKKTNRAKTAEWFLA